MDNEFTHLELAVREANQVTSVALHCAIFVLRRAHELPVGQRKEMLEILKALISEGEGKAIVQPPDHYTETESPQMTNLGGRS